MRFMTQAMIYTMVLTKVTVGVVLDWGAMLSSAFACLLFNFCLHIRSFSQALNGPEPVLNWHGIKVLAQACSTMSMQLSVGVKQGHSTWNSTRLGFAKLYTLQRNSMGNFEHNLPRRQTRPTYEKCHNIEVNEESNSSNHMLPPLPRDSLQ